MTEYLITYTDKYNLYCAKVIAADMMEAQKQFGESDGFEILYISRIIADYTGE